MFSQEFFEKWTDVEEPKKNAEAKQSWSRTSGTTNCTSWHKLEYVEQVVQGEAGLQIYVDQEEQGGGGLQIVVEQVEQGQGICPAEPLHLFQSGSTRPWKIVGNETLL